LGVSRQGEFENTRKEIEYVSENFTREICFRGGGDFLTFVPFRLFCCVG
jgi:hypothetical protein